MRGIPPESFNPKGCLFRLSNDIIFILTFGYEPLPKSGSTRETIMPQGGPENHPGESPVYGYELRFAAAPKENEEVVHRPRSEVHAAWGERHRDWMGTVDCGLWTVDCVIWGP
jgi:hypothetical protein